LKGGFILSIELNRYFFLKVSVVIGQKELSFAFIAIGICEVMKVFGNKKYPQ
jgi:hypothetical protein